MKAVLLIVAFTALAGAAWLVFRGSPSVETGAADSVSAPEGVARSVVTGSAVRVIRADKRTVQARKRVRVAVSTEDDDMTAADRRLYDAVQEAWDAEDVAAVRRTAAEAYGSENVEVRQQAVDALAWFGEKTLAELTPMMADADPDVAESARDAWESALVDIESAADRLHITRMALKAVSDAETLEMVGSQFSDAASELIDEEEDEAKAQRYRVEVVQTLVDLIGDGLSSERAVQAKEIYESVTCNEWISAEEAERYLRDPDGYEPPEDRGD